MTRLQHTKKTVHATTPPCQSTSIISASGECSSRARREVRRSRASRVCHHSSDVVLTVLTVLTVLMALVWRRPSAVSVRGTTEPPWLALCRQAMLIEPSLDLERRQPEVLCCRAELVRVRLLPVHLLVQIQQHSRAAYSRTACIDVGGGGAGEDSRRGDGSRGGRGGGGLGSNDRTARAG